MNDHEIEFDKKARNEKHTNLKKRGVLELKTKISNHMKRNNTSNMDEISLMKVIDSYTKDIAIFIAAEHKDDITLYTPYNDVSTVKLSGKDWIFDVSKGKFLGAYLKNNSKEDVKESVNQLIHSGYADNNLYEKCGIDTYESYR